MIATSRLAARPLLAAALLALAGCASYTTPGGPVDLAGIQSAEISELMSREAAASFPATLGVVRVQAPGYRSRTAETWGDGRFLVVTNRELMSDERLDEIAAWPGIRAVTPLSRLILPSSLESIDDLRTAGARLRADMLVVFTLDTGFRVDGRSIGPLSVVSLGLMRDRETVINTTASAIFVDVRTGFVYGVAEATAGKTQVTNAWDTVNAADQGRVETEREAFAALMGELEKTWRLILAEHQSD